MFRLFLGPKEKTSFKTAKNPMLFECFILGHVGPSYLHRDRSRCHLDANAASSSKNAPLCSRLLVLLKSTPRRARKPCKTPAFWAILKTSTTLQPFARFAMTPHSEAPPAAKAGPEKAHHSAAVCPFSSYFTLISRAFETTETNTKPVHQPFNISCLLYTSDAADE